ncbi:MAG: acetyltransferase [Clostridia bacterium]|nr:acetyltransferase [Clostridia bacterium]
MQKGLLLIGGGGHCKSVLCALLAAKPSVSIGIIDSNLQGSLYGVPVVGRDEDLPLLREQYSNAFISVGSVGNTHLRRKLYMLAKEAGYIFPNIIDPAAIVSPYASLGKGVFIGKGAVVNAGARIGDCAILNTGSIVEHDCVVGDFAHIAPGAVLDGNVYIGEDTHIGSKAVVIQGLCVGERTVIGAGSTVLSDIPANVVAVGTPCRTIKTK